MIAALISAALLVLASPRHDQLWLAWIGLVPLLLTLKDRRPAHAFLVASLCGFAYFSGILIWVYQIPGFKPLHHVLVGAILGPCFGLFGAFFSQLVRRKGLAAAYFLAPFVWVSVEYLRSNLWFLSLPWGFLAHTQYLFPQVIQISAFTGAYGVSFLVVAVNSCLALLLAPSLSRVKGHGSDNLRPPSTEMRRAWALSVAVLVGATLLYGQVSLGRPLGEKRIRIAVLQGNIDLVKKADPRKFAQPIMQTYVDLTEQAARDNPELIVWPEAATPGLVLKSSELNKQIVGLIRKHKTAFVIGSSEYPKFSREPAAQKRQGNTALHVAADGRILGQYLKIHLVPFGEYLPLEDVFAWPAWLLESKGRSWDLPGTEHTLFTAGGGAFGVVICWEQVFPELFRTFVRNGARFMLNLTNEGWFGDSDAPYQMLAISVFRAVENGVPLARAANTGISGFIDRRGRIDGLVNVNGKPTFVAGHLTRDVVFSDQTTFYTRHGDLFVYGVLTLTALAAAWLFVPRGQRGTVEAAVR